MPRRATILGLCCCLGFAACDDAPAGSADGRPADRGPAPGDGGLAADAARPDAPRGDGQAGDATALPPPAGVPLQYVPRIVPTAAAPNLWDDGQRATIFWFGQVDAANNHVDCRVGYDDSALLVSAHVFDQKIYDLAQDDDLAAWDAITLLLDLDGDRTKAALDERSLRIDAQAHRHGTARHAVYAGRAGAWVKELREIQLIRGYRGEGPDQSRGWAIDFVVPWPALGLAAPPAAPGQRLRAALVAYDRDSADGSAGGAPQSWPAAAPSLTSPATWGVFELLGGHLLGWAESGSQPGAGRASYAVAAAIPAYVAGSEQTLVVRHGLDGAQVEDTCVGASATLCSGDDAYNFGDGPQSWGGNTSSQFFHVQNQGDIADWPCYAKIYVKFPLDRLPADRVVVSAKLSLHHKEPTSAGDEGERSLIHAFRVASTLRDGVTPWTAANLAWNTAPLAQLNLAGTWGDRTGMMSTGWDALPRWEWDVTAALQGRAAASHASFALYSSDTQYHTGKQFVSSEDFPDWGNPAQRPTLTIVHAAPQE